MIFAVEAQHEKQSCWQVSASVALRAAEIVYIIAAATSRRASCNRFRKVLLSRDLTPVQNPHGDDTA